MAADLDSAGISMTRASPPWLKPVAEFGPLVIFIACYFTVDFITATAALLAVTPVALGLLYYYERQIAYVPLLTAAIVGVFGGLTIWTGDERFYKMKPTIVQALFAVVLLGGLLFGRSLLKPLFGSAWAMDEAGWRKLTFRFGVFFAVAAVANEVVWRTQSTDFWVLFKFPGLVVVTFAFTLSQLPMIQRHSLPDPGSSDDSA